MHFGGGTHKIWEKIVREVHRKSYAGKNVSQPYIELELNENVNGTHTNTIRTKVVHFNIPCRS